MCTIRAMLYYTIVPIYREHNNMYISVCLHFGVDFGFRCCHLHIFAAEVLTFKRIGFGFYFVHMHCNYIYERAHT